MKVCLAQLNYHTGNFELNSTKIIQTIEACKGSTDLVVFAELAVCGYPPRDFLEFNHFIDLVEETLQNIAAHCTNITAIVGAPAKNTSGKGKPLHNAAFVLANGKIQEVVYKTLLPNYDIFDEYRYFEPNRSFKCVEIAGEKVALTVCEDLWNVDDVPLYYQNPMDELIAEKPGLMVNIAASPFSGKQAIKRNDILAKNAQRYHLPIVYVNHVGAQTELIFDGDSRFVNADGNTVASLPQFKESLLYIDTEETKPQKPTANNPIAMVHDALVLGIKDYFGKLGLKKATLGLSGGIDSAVVCALAVEALGAENVLPVLLPSQYTHSLSVSEAEKLAQNLGCAYKTIPIKNIYTAFEQELSEHFKGLANDVTEENLQARSRGVILMALSNKLGYILLNTTNKSEMAVGYGTLYGDLCGGLSVIGDVYKTAVYELAEYINRNEEIIPRFIIDRPPSAELKEDQKDSDSLPPYEQLDPLLHLYIEQRKGPEELIKLGFDAQVVKRVLKLVNQSEWKRYQTAPILRVSEKAFGMGRRMPIVAKYLS
ncbi:NAD+ synthase [bacterium]|nr:NAD+ synthase [bacterium]